MDSGPGPVQVKQEMEKALRVQYMVLMARVDVWTEVVQTGRLPARNVMLLEVWQFSRTDAVSPTW
eukprot:7163642-Lingulodinium_polyedra.AAC.1